MTIWILALVLLAAGAGLGFRQGAIRTAISFVGIVSAVLFAGILGNLLKPLLPHVGIQNPTLIWALAPLVAFIIVLILFKVAGFFVHRKVYLFYKYKAGDLRMALWERLNSRLRPVPGLAERHGLPAARFLCHFQPQPTGRCKSPPPAMNRLPSG